MAREILTEVIINGKQIYHYNSVTIRQSFNAHHTFELILDQDSVEALGGHTLDKAQDFIGKFFTICFGEKDAGENIFRGLITEVALAQDEGLWGNLVLKGFSPTILMDSGPHYTSYEKVTLKDLMEISCKGVAGNDMEISNKPVRFTESIAYTSQYGESFFTFINRMASEYGEWFFFDGNTLYLGRPSKQEKSEMVYGEHISRMNFSMKILPSNFSQYSYISKNDEVLTSPLPKKVDSANSYTKKSLEVSDSLYLNKVHQPSNVRVNNQGDLDKYAKTLKEKFAASTVQLNGDGDNAKIKLGHIIDVKVSRKGIGVGYDDHGQYTVTSLSHYFRGTGEYHNTFEAIPSANEVMPFFVRKPLAETQIAVVKDNNDPDGLGRIRVQMLWQKEENKMTDWIRVLTPDGGGSGKVSKNRGMVFIPEVGDQVMVGFRENDPNRPFVMGSMFHGKNASGGGSGNNTKSLSSKSGCTVTLDDAAGSVTISDPSGNSIIMHGDGTMTIEAKTKLEIKSKEIIITGEQTVTVEGKNKVDVKSKEVAIDGTTKATLNSSTKVEIGSPSTNVEGKAQLKLQSQGMVDVEGTAMTNVKGGLLNLNCG
jgi:type VI secretion system secreted protein VgrG